MKKTLNLIKIYNWQRQKQIFLLVQAKNTNADGNPQEGISLETLGDSEYTYPPEDELTVAGFPEEGQIQKYY